jgi:very-short-patch-repair endonuclease
MTNSYQPIIEAFCKQSRIAPPVPEFRFHPVRKWRFDFAWPALRVALEIEGGVYAKGRHTRGKGFEADIEKYNTAALLGWTVIRATTGQLQAGKAFQWIEEAMQCKQAA